MDTATLVLSGTMAIDSNGGIWSTATKTNDTLTISPISAWTRGEHTLIVDVNNSYGAILSTLTLNYTVDPSLAVNSVVPGNNSTIIGNDVVVITFNKTVDTTLLAASGSLWVNGDGGVWSATTYADDTLTIAPASLWPEGAIDLTLDIADLTGNSLATLNLAYTVAAATCSDVVQNQDETDVDCGGSSCSATCADGLACIANADCDSNLCTANVCTSDPDGDGDGSPASLDCDDADATVYPGATEVVDDGIDQDCSGSDTISCTVDVDGDGFGTVFGTVVLASDGSCDALEGESDFSTDCNDSSASIYPGAAELCNGNDDDCNGATADGIDEVWLGDACDGLDTDLCIEGTYSCEGGFRTCSDTTGDDVEICYDSIDNDCDGTTDFGDADCSAVCGDSVTTAPEVCDDGGESATCDGDCTSVVCGDGYINATASEVCDAGGDSADCDSDCTFVACGDGYTNAAAGEACDDSGESATCDVDCTAAVCGDEYTNIPSGEQCDDGLLNNDTTPDACRTTCLNPICGDNAIDTGEECDGGLLNNDTTPDACRTACLNPWCGDNVIDTGEQCDDGNNIDGDGCSATCLNPWCGDGVLDAGEECDDGNNTDGDGCSAICLNPICGDGVVDASNGEQCDDAGESVTCNADCTAAVCGDGFFNPTAGEECDDNNNTDGDGCSAACLIEPPPA